MDGAADLPVQCRQTGGAWIFGGGLQLFQLQGRGDAEHALVAIETAVRHEDVAVMLVINPDKGFKIVLYTAVVSRRL